jgi:hypothetical protein
MGNRLFGSNIAGIIASKLGPLLLPGVLIRSEPGTRDPTNLGAGTEPVETQHTFRGVKGDYSQLRPASIINDFNATITLLGDTIQPPVIPEAMDKIIIEGQEFTIVGPVLRDPDAATYVCQCT